MAPKRRSRKTTKVQSRGPAVPSPSRETARKAASVPRPVRTMSSAEELLKAVAAEVGLGRAMVILASERARLRSVIGS
jgi:hypothetical protein